MKCPFLSLLLILFLINASQTDAMEVTTKELSFADAPPDNPLRGLVPYDGASGRTQFPHSIEFSYFSLKELMTGMDEFQWGTLDDKLSRAQSRGMQFNFRVWIEYPNRGDSLPDFLRGSVAVSRWEEKNDDGKVTNVNYSPDYEAPALRAALKSFIAALGKRYDTEDTIGFITVGLLGKWGEWHNFDQSYRMASKEVQKEVMGAYMKAFQMKKLVLRYPAGPSGSIVENVNEPFGYHDDSFGMSTLYEGGNTPSWYFGAQLIAAGATEKWKTFPIGGEVHPDLFDNVFTPSYKGQDFVRCVEQTHVSWLRDSGMFSDNIAVDANRIEAATEAVSKMGYAFHILKAEKQNFGSDFSLLWLTVENRGVAPFYYDRPIYVQSSQESKYHMQRHWKLSEILPGESVNWFAIILDAPEYMVSIPNPMKNGKALRFSNKEQVGDILRIQFD